jgi:hypothetical protein
MIILFAIIFICLIEVYHDKFVILGGDGRKKWENSMWHKTDLFLWIIVYGLVAYVVNDWRIFLFAALCRQFMMHVVLNLALDKPTFYLSDKGVDKVLKRIGGETVAVISLLGAVAMGLWILLH